MLQGPSPNSNPSSLASPFEGSSTSQDVVRDAPSAQTGATTTAQTSVQPAVQPTPAQREAARHGAMIAMISLLAIIALLVVYGIVWGMRRRAAATAPRVKATTPPGPDPWAESARRLATPDAQDLEDTRVGQALSEREPPKAARAFVAPKTSTGQAPIVLVTGAGKRIGRAIALHFAQQGCDVILTYNTSREAAESLAREVSSLGRQATLYQLSLDDLHAVRAFSSRLASTLPRLDVLVHNASTYEPTSIYADAEGTPALVHHEEAEMQMKVNALAPLVLTLGLAGVLRNSSLAAGGCVLALGDVHSMGHPRKNHSAYAMSKAALHEMVRSLARDFAPRVRVNALALGVALWPEDGPEASPAEQAKYLRRVPLAREGSPEEVAQAAYWIAFHATYMTGQIVPLDGGRGLT